MSNSTQSNKRDDVIEAQWFSRITTTSLLIFLLYKLFPYDFSQINSLSIEFIIQQFSQDNLVGLEDYIELFIGLSISALLGFGLAGLLRNRQLGAVTNLLIILLICAGLAMATETLQAVILMRNPNWWDVMTDCLGGFVGWLSFYQWRFRFFHCVLIAQQQAKRYLSHYISLRTLATGFVAYFLIAATSMMILPTATDFINWNSSYSLILGNEQTGDRPWQGAIAQVQFFDRALPTEAITQLLFDRLPPPVHQDALLASYQLDEQQNRYRDQTGQLSDLTWHGEPSETQGDPGIMLSSTHWLHTATPATYLNQQIQQNAQLTLNLIVTPASLDQSGPARIVSLSADTSHRNFTLGQEGKNLVLRLRTPVTGNNGSNPQIIVSQVFTDLSSHHLVVTYANSNLRVYVDEPRNLHTFWLPHSNYKVPYYGLIFIPLGGLLGLIFSVTRGSLTARITLLLSGIVLPSLLLEGLLAAVNQRSFAWANFGMSQALMLSTLFLMRKQIARYFKVE